MGCCGRFAGVPTARVLDLAVVATWATWVYGLGYPLTLSDGSTHEQTCIRYSISRTKRDRTTMNNQGVKAAIWDITLTGSQTEPY